MGTCATTEFSAQVFELRPLPPCTSQGDLLAYIDRTRRQLDRFEQLPKAAGRIIDPDAAVRLRAMCDELEADILIGLTEGARFT
jgi:hypothetical protein